MQSVKNKNDFRLYHCGLWKMLLTFEMVVCRSVSINRHCTDYIQYTVNREGSLLSTLLFRYVQAAKAYQCNNNSFSFATNCWPISHPYSQQSGGCLWFPLCFSFLGIQSVFASIAWEKEMLKHCFHCERAFFFYSAWYCHYSPWTYWQMMMCLLSSCHEKWGKAHSSKCDTVRCGLGCLLWDFTSVQHPVNAKWGAVSFFSTLSIGWAHRMFSRSAHWSVLSSVLTSLFKSERSSSAFCEKPMMHVDVAYFILQFGVFWCLAPSVMHLKDFSD